MNMTVISTEALWLGGAALMIVGAAIGVLAMALVSISGDKDEG